MYQYPTSIKNLINHFAELPGIGPKTAERLVIHLLKNNIAAFEKVGQELLAIKNQIKNCSVCNNFSEQNICSICSDVKRDKTKICLVAEPQDVIALERTDEFNGLYHLLGGMLAPADGVTPDKLRIKELETRVRGDKKIQFEVIIALDPTVEGESTSMYLTKVLKQYANVKISKLARGLPMGGDLEYADEVTLKSALRGRTEQ